MTWTISIPYQHLDEPLSATAGFARHLPAGDDREVARQIVFGAMERGVRTAGDLLDQLSAMALHERRETLDTARKALGLPATADVDARKRAQGITRVDLVPGLQICHAPDCDNFPTTDSGSWRPVNVCRWFCAAHEHLADDGDLADLGSGLRLSESGVPIPAFPGEAEREAAAEESRARQQRARRADRERDAAARSEQDKSKRDAIELELPAYLRRTPA